MNLSQIQTRLESLIETHYKIEKLAKRVRRFRKEWDFYGGETLEVAECHLRLAFRATSEAWMHLDGLECEAKKEAAAKVGSAVAAAITPAKRKKAEGAHAS